MSHIQNVKTFRKYREESGVEINKIYLALELIGIYLEFKKQSCNNDEFPDFYRITTEKRKYSYRNKGIEAIYGLVDHKKAKCHITRRSIRRTGICIKTARIYEGTDYMIDAIVKYIKTDDYLYGFYCNHIHTNEIDKYLLYQYDIMHHFNQVRYGFFSKIFKRILDNVNKIIKVSIYEKI